jgi:hypothetical protein
LECNINISSLKIAIFAHTETGMKTLHSGVFT